MTREEICVECDGPTGKAGRGEDSLYAGESGPYCETCWDNLRETLSDRLYKSIVQNAKMQNALAEYEKRFRADLTAAGMVLAPKSELDAIGRLSNPSPYRTLGEASDNLACVNDHYRAMTEAANG